ncbi:MAG: hypothetical protein QOE17_244 [Gaiellales bacterium]|nr:hypothetical protein [Gaiellales bacterium]
MTAALFVAFLWGAWTTINVLWLGPRGSNPAIYWPSGLAIAGITLGIGWTLRRRARRSA